MYNETSGERFVKTYTVVRRRWPFDPSSRVNRITQWTHLQLDETPIVFNPEGKQTKEFSNRFDVMQKRWKLQCDLCEEANIQMEVTDCR